MTCSVLGPVLVAVKVISTDQSRGAFGVIETDAQNWRQSGSRDLRVAVCDYNF